MIATKQVHNKGLSSLNHIVNMANLLNFTVFYTVNKIFHFFFNIFSSQVSIYNLYILPNSF